MKQVVLIHGGSSYNSYESYLDNLQNSPISYERLLPQSKWRDWLALELTDEFDLLLPSFPNSSNAVYEEWKIYFEKLIPLLDLPNTQLIGYSLGGMFLANYLHANTLPTPVQRIILLAPGYDDDSNEELGSFKVTSASKLAQNAQEIHLFHSKDDPVVPYSELAKFEKDLPSAHVHRFTDRSHFFTPTFPELLKLLKQK